jgi:hypothetical protein
VRKIIPLLMLCALPVMAQDALPLWMVMMESGEIVYNYLIAADLSTNNNDGTCSHTSILAYVDSGWIGDLDGSTESINCGDILYVDDSVGESLSVSAWVYFDDATDVNQTIICKDNTSGADREWCFNFGGTANRRLTWLMFDYVPSPGYIARQATTAFPMDEWHHVVATYDGSRSATGMVIYVDGDVYTTTDVSVGSYSGQNNSGTAVIIGMRASSLYHLDGLVTDVGVWKRNISESETETMYAAGKHAGLGILNTTNIVAVWSMMPEEE